MTSVVTRTPPLTSRVAGRHLPQQPPARTRPKPYNFCNSPGTRPDTPRFILQDVTNVSGVFGNMPQTLSVAPAGPSKQLILKDPSGKTTKTNQHGKRPAEMIDLTHTTGGISEPSSVRKAKKSKSLATNNTATTDAKRKSKTKQERRAEQQEKATVENSAWREKYKTAFPSFVFYFDAIDANTVSGMVKAVQRLGATVDNFFSKKVTHVVTSRTVPALNVNKENLNSPFVSHSLPRPNSSLVTGLKESTSVSSRAKNLIARSPNGGHILRDTQKLRHLDGQDKNPFIDSQDILSKASEFGLKIWRLEKTQLILARMNSNSPKKPDVARTLSLPSLLREEQLFGTRERDPFVLRPDTYYFPPKACYILVEDSTGEHRPIITKEYARPPRGEDPSWPVVWGGVEGRGAFYHYEGPPIVHQARKNFDIPFVPLQDRQGFATVAARAVAGGPPLLRRTVSLNRGPLNIRGRVPEDFVAASGNSVTITSNIASATSNQSGAVRGAVQGKGMCDRRLAALKRTLVPMEGPGAGMLKRSTSVDAGLNKRVPPPRDEPKKSGYCENCRNKYEDFKEHIVSRKHVKFARTASNWTELDDLLSKISRPLAPVYSSDPEEDSGFYEQDDIFSDSKY